jgi:hypothetical protein
VSHGVIIGPVAVATRERVVLGDGAEFSVGRLAPPDLATGMPVKILYSVADRSRVPESITRMSNRRQL